MPVSYQNSADHYNSLSLHNRAAVIDAQLTLLLMMLELITSYVAIIHVTSLTSFHSTVERFIYKNALHHRQQTKQVRIVNITDELRPGVER